MQGYFYHLHFKQAQPKMCRSPRDKEKVENNFFTSLTHILRQLFKRTLNCHISYAVRAFDPIPALRARPKYQLSADTHSHKAGTKLQENTFAYSQPW